MLTVKVKKFPICLQDSQKLQIHQIYADLPQGCYNIARIRDYILLKKGIPFQRSSNSTAVTLYHNLPTLETAVWAIPHFKQ
jgi:hypothetical protein